MGLAFANILMFTQLGFLSVLTKGSTQIQENLTGDLLLVSASNKSLQIKTSFPDTRLYQAEFIDGVASASPVYISWGRWVNPESLSQKTFNKPLFFNFVKIIAFNPSQPLFCCIPSNFSPSQQYLEKFDGSDYNKDDTLLSVLNLQS